MRVVEYIKCATEHTMHTQKIGNNEQPVHKGNFLYCR